MTHTTREGITFNRETFIRDYATQFVASWAAKHYEDYCVRGMQDHLSNAPWEDALFCGEEAWKHLIAL